MVRNVTARTNANNIIPNASKISFVFIVSLCLLRNVLLSVKHKEGLVFDLFGGLDT
jgi:hypothetical protein